MKKPLYKLILSTFLLILFSMISACSSLTGSDEGANESPVEQSNANASGYYRGHYGQSGWDDSVMDKAYTKGYPVFTSNKNANKSANKN